MDQFDFASHDAALLDFAAGLNASSDPSTAHYPHFSYSQHQQHGHHQHSHPSLPHSQHPSLPSPQHDQSPHGTHQPQSWPAATPARTMDSKMVFDGIHNARGQTQYQQQPQQQHSQTYPPPNSTLPPQHQPQQHAPQQQHQQSYSSRPSSNHSNQSLGLQTHGLDLDYGMLPTNWQYQMAQAQQQAQQQALAQQQAQQEQQRQQQVQQQSQFHQDLQTNNVGMGMNAYGSFGNLQSSPVGMLPASSTDTYAVPSALGPSAFMSMAGPMDSMNALAFPLTDYQNESNAFAMAQTHQVLNQHALNQLTAQAAAQSVQSSSSGGSPTGTILEVQSLSDNEWSMVNYNTNRNSLDSYSGTVSNPSQNLHIRTNSDSSSSDAADSAELSGSYEEVPPWPVTSPHDFHGSDYLNAQYISQHQPRDMRVNTQQLSTSPTSSLAVSPTAVSYRGHSSSTSPTSSGPTSPPIRRRKPSTVSAIEGKTTKSVIKKASQTTRKEGGTEKKVGRRKGPLRPDQRQSAHEIRKMRACVRCKFLKKTCDTGEPCSGCKPSHARLWQVPCTRLDIKELGYFMKDWKADYDRHVSLGFSVGNIKGFSPIERTIYITHGYGFYIPLQAREVFTRDEGCFTMDWAEGAEHPKKEFEVKTLRLSAGVEGVSTSVLSEYLERHLDQGFEVFVDNHFEGTKFVTEILKTSYRYWQREQTPSVRKALKLLLAYNLTQQVTMVEGLSEDEQNVGKIDDDSSKFFGKTFAPVMINFQIKCALADMWRELQKEILEDLSSLYSSVYSKHKLKNWPTIFMVASLLLVIWEEMQFDCHYRVPDEAAVHKFCDDMEHTPVGVIIGLFHAISTKLPGIQEWDSKKHHQLLGSNPSICDALTEVKGHVNKYESYLKERQSTAKFDREDLDSLSNKFLSKLVIRAN